MSRILLSAISLCALTFATAIASPPQQSELSRLPNASFPTPHRIASGRLQASDMATLKKAGVREIIDLRGDSETPDFDEQAAVRKAGMIYHNLPIRGADDLNRGNVERFDQLLANAGDHRTLVHCASSNRVGAMIALRAAFINGQSIEAALAEGRRWGLKSMQPMVRQRLNAWSGSTPQPPATR